jgi:outer membrane protein
MGASASVLLALLAAAASADPPALSLAEARAKALHEHNAMVQAEAQSAAALARTQSVRSGGLPNIAIQGAASDGPSGAPVFGAIGNPANFGALPYSLQGLAGDPLKKQFGIGLNISQNLFDSGRTHSLTLAKTDLYLAARQDEAAQRSLVLLAVTQKYLNVLALRELVTVQNQMLTQRQATEQQARLFTEAQVKAAVELQTAVAHSSEARGALIGAENDLKAGFAELNNAMGATSLQEYSLAAPLTEPTAAMPKDLTMAIAVALKNRPEISSAMAAVKAEEHTIKGVQSELQPRVDAVASLGLINPSSLVHASENYAVGVAVTIPVFSGGQVEGRIKEEREKRKAALAQQEAVKEAVRLQVSRAWLDVETRRAQFTAAKEQQAAADSALSLASERYKLQLSSLIELSDAETTAARARAAAVNAQYAVILAEQVLSWALGGPDYVVPTGKGVTR